MMHLIPVSRKGQFSPSQNITHKYFIHEHSTEQRKETENGLFLLVQLDFFFFPVFGL